MTAVISENVMSRPFTLATFGGQSGRELIFDVLQSDDEEEVRTLIEATAPDVYLQRTLDSIDVERVGPNVWKGHCHYIRWDANNEYTFDTGGGTAKITQSLATIATAAAPGWSAPDFQGAIGVSDEKVEGVDIVTPTFNWTESHDFLDSQVNGAYKSVLMGYTGKVNNAAFKGLNPGECLFMGATGSKRGDEQWRLTFKFSGSPNAVGIMVGTVGPFDKDGWDYLWVRYADFVDGTAFQIVKRPIACYVERVYARVDFSQLQVGVV